MLQFRLVEQPEYQPRTCRNCGGHQDRKWWLDLSYQEEFYGHVYFCNVCTEQMAKVVGFIPAEELTAVKYAHQKELDESIDKEVYVSLYNRLFGAGTNPHDMLRLLDEPESSRIRSRIDEAIQRRESDTVESNHVGGPSDVSGAPKNLELNFGE